MAKLIGDLNGAPVYHQAKKVGFWRVVNAYILLIGGYPYELFKIAEEEAEWQS
jgi:hypothetical protein